MIVPLKDRKRFLASLPWVTFLDDMPRLGKNLPRCQGIRWGKVALKDLYSHGPGGSLPPRGLEHARCTRRAHWRLKAKKSRSRRHDEATSGDYCWDHIVQQSYRDLESKRFQAAWEEWKKEEGIS